MTQQALVASSNITIGHLLDRTGSMSGTEDQVVEAINLFMQKMCGDEKGKDARFILRQFDSMGFDILRRGLMHSMKPVEVREYEPRAMTPLFDAIIDFIEMVEGSDTEKNMLIIQTDGLENDSKKHSLADVKALIEQKRKDGWIIIYLGANIDAWKQAEEIGIPGHQALNYKQGRKNIPDQAHASQPWSKVGEKAADNPIVYALGTIALLGFGYFLLNPSETNAASLDQLGFDDIDRNAAMGVTGVDGDTWQNAVASDVDGFTEPVASVFDLSPELAEQHTQLPPDFDPALGSIIDGEQVGDPDGDILSSEDVPANADYDSSSDQSEEGVIDSDDHDNHDDYGSGDGGSDPFSSSDDDEYFSGDDGESTDIDSLSDAGDSDFLDDLGEVAGDVIEGAADLLS